MANRISSTHVLSSIFSTVLFFASFTTLATTSATTLATEKQASVSLGDMKKNNDTQLRNNISQTLKQVLVQKNERKSNQLPALMNNTKSVEFSGKTRSEIINSQRLKSTLQKSAKQSASSRTLPDFAIYGATSYWQDDYDYDGYHKTFSVTFDADLYSYDNNSLAEVYAVLYLSRNGGDWVEYHTTNNFIIEGDSDLDEYEVFTTLISGYPPSEYDVLIDLYIEGYSEIVATYSSDDTNALYALPLESEDYDEPYVEVIEVVDGGSMSALALLLFLVFAYRYFLKIEEN